MPAAPTMDLPTIDPTPGPGDVTNFDQVKGGPPAKHPSQPGSSKPVTPARPASTKPTAPKPTPKTPAPAPKPAPEPKEVQLGAPSDPNRANQIPEDILDGLDALATPEGGPRPVEEPAPEPEATVPEPEPATEQPEAVDAEPDAQSDAELERIVQAGKTLKDVRTAHKEVLKRERALKTEIAEVQKRLTEAETRAAAYKPDDIKATATELESARKRLQEMETTIRTLDYTKSTEFHEKFIRPKAKALESAYADLSEMLVTLPDGTSRAATREDFQELLRLPLPAATAKAKELFGDLSGEVLAHRRSVIQLDRAGREAVQGAQKLAEEAHAKELAEQTQRAERLATVYKATSDEITGKWPDLFKPREGDDEGNAWLEKGGVLVNSLESQDLSEDDRIKIAAMVRHRATAFPRVVFDLQRAIKERDAALAKLSKYEKSSPRDGDGTTGGPPAEPMDPMEKALRSIDKMATRNPAFG